MCRYLRIQTQKKHNACKRDLLVVISSFIMKWLLCVRVRLCVGELTVGVLALDASSGSPAVLLRLEELLCSLWLLEKAVRWDTKDTDGSQTDTRTKTIRTKKQTQNEGKWLKRHYF